VSGGQTPYTYSWKNSSNVTVGTTQDITVTSPDTYTLTVTGANGCSASDSVVVTQNISVPSVNAGPDKQLTCNVTSVLLDATVSGGQTPYTYSWKNSSNVTVGTTQDITVTSPDTYTLTVTGANGCWDSDSVVVTQNVIPPTATASSNSPVAQGATIQLAGGPDGMASYYWTGPGGWTNSDQNPTRTGATTAMEGTYTLTVTNSNGCTDDVTTNVVVTVPVTPAAAGGGCPTTKYLTVDWEGNNTTQPLYSNNCLAVDLLGPSPDISDSLFLERGTHAPVVDERTYYLIVVRELEQIPPVPENYEAIVVLNITPMDAEFNRDIFLTVGLNQTQLPQNVLNLTMAYYNDVNRLWETLEYEAGGPNGVAELTLSAPINHFSIYGVLAKLGPTTPTSPAHFVPSGPTMEHNDKKISAFVTKTWETVTITANIANDGGQEGTYSVVLKLNGQTVDTKTVTIGAGQSKQVSFTQSGLDYGQYEVNIAGLTDEFTTSRTITWWLIILIIVAIGLIIWGVVWGRRRRRKTPQEA